MKIQRFNKLNESTPPPSRREGKGKIFPLKCKYKNKIYDVFSVDFEFQSVRFSYGKGSGSQYASLNDVEFIPDIFLFDKYNL